MEFEVMLEHKTSSFSQLIWLGNFLAINDVVNREVVVVVIGDQVIQRTDVAHDQHFLLVCLALRGLVLF